MSHEQSQDAAGGDVAERDPGREPLDEASRTEQSVDHDAIGVDRSDTELPVHLIAAVAAARAKKATDILVLDVRAVTPFADHFVIASGSSVRQVQAIAEAVQAKLRDLGHRPRHIEGLTVGEWVLIDCVDLVVHVFTADKRQAYNLERLWSDGEVVEVPEAAA